MGFSQEMKDFIGAYQAGQKINASRTDQDYKEAQTRRTSLTTDRENDPETLKIAGEQERAKLAVLQDRLRTGAASRAASAARTGLINDQRKLLQGSMTQGSGLLVDGAVTPGGTLAPQPQGVLPIPRSTLDDQTDMYVDGGLVPEDDEEEEEGVLPMDVPAPAAAPTDVSAQSRRDPRAPRGLEGVISPALVADATKAGMTFAARELGGGALRSPAQQAKARALAMGQGGLTDQEMAAARKAVDPEGKLTDSQRNMAALGSVYQFWANKGEGQKAERVAFQMLQHYRNAAQRYAAIAAKAAEGGNVDLATKAALKAYANVPDGNDLELLPNPDGGIMYAVTGPNGEVINKGIATPQQLAASAMGLASGGFDKAILSAAGAREAQQGAVNPKGGGRPQSAADRAKEEETAGAAVEKMKTKWAADEKNKGKPVDEEFWEQAGNVATHIMQQNKVTSSEAARAAELLISPGKKDPEKPDYKITPGEEGKPSKVKFGNGLTIELDDNQLEQAINARTARTRKAVDEIDAKMTALEGPDRASQAIEGVKQVGKGVGDFLAGGGVTGAAARTVSSAASKIGGVLKDIYGEHIPQGVLDVVKEEIDTSAARGAARRGKAAAAVTSAFAPADRGAIPVDDNDRPL